MFYVLVGVAFLFLAVATVKAVEAKGTKPYFIAYFVVVLAGFYGMISIGRIIDLLKDYPVEAGLSAVMGIISLKIASWGLNTFKRIQMEA